MSDLIRTVRSSWLPMPTRSSSDVPAPSTPNSYRLAQMAIEASERLHQRQIDRTIRAGRQPSVTLTSKPLALHTAPIGVLFTNSAVFK